MQITKEQIDDLKSKPLKDQVIFLIKLIDLPRSANDSILKDNFEELLRKIFKASLDHKRHKLWSFNFRHHPDTVECDPRKDDFLASHPSGDPEYDLIYKIISEYDISKLVVK